MQESWTEGQDAYFIILPVRWYWSYRTTGYYTRSYLILGKEALTQINVKTRREVLTPKVTP